MGLFSWLEAWLNSTRENRLRRINAPVTPPSPLTPALFWPHPPISSCFDPSPDFASSGASARVVDLIILHCTEGALPGAVAWLTAKDATPVSAHYLVGKKGDLVQMVGENDVAYHAGGTKEQPSSWNGRKNINGRSIGIELENRNDGQDPYPAPQLAVLLWLVLRSCRRFNLAAEQVVGHADVDPGRKTDPAAFPWETFRRSLAFHLSRFGGLT